jgi:FtsP/CotA-like multicopper oxidase with cupredoxin domain
MAGVVTAAGLLRVDSALAAEAQTRPFRVPLRIPRVMTPTRKDGRDLYEVVMRKARREIVPGTRTPIWGFDGSFPGPTIKARRGREVVIRRYNCLEVPTTIHLHGGRVTPSNDGQPTDLIRPGGYKDYFYPNEQDAATLWYHDHTHHHSSRNNLMGLNGLYIIEDPDEDELNLPKGKYDIPLVLQDRSFRRNGSFKFHDDHDNVFGDTYLVNGRPTPYLKVANRKYRFRILNASNSRGYNLTLDQMRPLVQIASDGGLLPAPAPTLSLPIWPSERAEVIIDFSQFPVGSKVVLHDTDPDNPLDSRPVMRFDVEREETDDSSLPHMLRTIERLVPDGPERQLDLSFDFNRNRWEINGKGFDPDRIDFRPKHGATEQWVFRNLSSATHPMHIHLVQFQILHRSNLAVSAGESGWKDTVRVDASATVQVAVKFPQRFRGRYMFHCHNLAHEDHSMMGQMKVV